MYLLYFRNKDFFLNIFIFRCVHLNFLNMQYIKLTENPPKKKKIMRVNN